MRRFLSCLLNVCLFFSLIPCAAAYEAATDLSGYISNRASRHYVEAMLGYHLRENGAVRETLDQGFSAVFFFEGCSDNMDDSELTDLTYYRVSAVCIVIRLDENGEPVIVYFNEDASTLPDRALEYGAWYLYGVGKVGPATVCDGTYELYSVYHVGAYEALHIRTAYSDETVPAVYMTPGGFVTGRADAINIHTRTGNHTIEKAMWSAGCMLVGDGDFDDFTELLMASYYSAYERFYPNLKVGTVTIDRQRLRKPLLGLYDNTEAVETLLTVSRCDLPETYLKRCTASALEEPRKVRVIRATRAMTLPCSNATDARSVATLSLSPGEKLEITGTVVNTRGNLWYQVDLIGETCYIYARDVEETSQSWLERMLKYFL